MDGAEQAAEAVFALFAGIGVLKWIRQYRAEKKYKAQSAGGEKT